MKLQNIEKIEWLKQFYCLSENPSSPLRDVQLHNHTALSWLHLLKSAIPKWYITQVVCQSKDSD